MPNTSTGCGSTGSASGKSPGATEAPAPGAVTGDTAGGLLPAAPAQNVTLGSIPAKPTADQIGTALDKVELTTDKAGKTADDCICAKLDRIAGSVDGLRGVIAELIIGQLQRAVDMARTAGTIAGSYSPTGGSAGATPAGGTYSGLIGGLADTVAGKDQAKAKPTGNDPLVGYSTDQVIPGVNAFNPDAKPAPANQLQLGLTNPDDKPKRKEELPLIPIIPGGYPVPTPGKWSVWRDIGQCNAVVVAPDQAPPTAGLVFVQAYDDQQKASDASKAINDAGASCVHEPEKITFPPPPSVWDRFKGCEQAAGQLNGVSPSDRVGFATAVGLRNRKGLPTIPRDLKEFTVFTLEIGVFFGWILRMFADTVDLLIVAFTGKSNPATQIASSYHVRAGMGRFLERWAGIDLPAAHVPDEYAGNFLDPQTLPSATEAAELYGANQVDRDTAMCWGRANGRLPSPFGKSLDARHAVPDPMGALRLERMGAADAKKTDERLRRSGWLTPGDRGDLEKLAIPAPGMSDIIRLMVRDVTNETAIRKADLDKGFEANWGSDLSKYAKWQGIPDDLAKLFWRAHWNIPGFTQLAEMYHRFRNLREGDPLKVTIADIMQALEQQDIAPGWIPRLLEMTFHPLTRVDAMRAYQLGAIGPAELTKSYTDLGYDDDKAQTLTRYTQNLTAERLLKTPDIQAFIKGETTWDQAAAGVDAIDKDKVLGLKVKIAATERRKRRRNAQCMTGIKHRFQRGEFTQEEARQELFGFGIAAEAAAAAVDEWDCARKAADLKPTVATLGRWYGSGLINTADIVGRLQRLGFARLDARRIAETAFADAQARQAAAERAAQKRMKGAAGKAARDNKTADKRKLEEVKAQERIRKAEQAAHERREAMLRAAAAAYSKKSGLHADVALVQVVQAYEMALSLCGADCKEAAAEAAKLAVGAWKEGGQTIWEIASSLVKVPVEQSAA